MAEKPDILELIYDYIEKTKSDVHYIEEFAKEMKNRVERAKRAGTTARKPEGVLCMTPDEVGDSAAHFRTLRGLVKSFITALPFTERIDAMKQFDDMFENNGLGSGKLYPDFSAIHRSRRGREREFQFCSDQGYFNDTEWQILLLKRLQKYQFESAQRAGTIEENAPNTRTGICTEMSTSDTTLASKIQLVEGEHDILGSRINIEMETGVSYDNTVHPVFLALNLAEVNFLTTILREKFKGEKLENMACDIAYDVYRQLSEYGKSIIDESAASRGIDFEKGPIFYDPGDKTYKAYKPAIGYREGDKNVFGIIEKRPCICRVILKWYMDREIQGKLECPSHNLYTLTEENGTVYSFAAWEVKMIKFISFA